MSLDIVVCKSIYQEPNLWSPNGFVIDDLVHSVFSCNLCVAGYCYIAYITYSWTYSFLHHCCMVSTHMTKGTVLSFISASSAEANW